MEYQDRCSEGHIAEVIGRPGSMPQAVLFIPVRVLSPLGGLPQARGLKELKSLACGKREPQEFAP